jgi:OOP family OmpA-OmpF porin
MFDRRTLAACCALALPAGVCLAQTTFAPDQYYDNRWYITPFGSYILPDSNRNAKDGWGGGVSIGKPISPSWNIELRGQYEELDGNFGTGFGAFNSTDKYKNWSGTLDAQWYFLGRQGINKWQTNSWQPYLVGGIGAIDNKVERAFGINDSHSSFMANAGVGVVWPFSSWGRLVADARYRYVDNANNSRTQNRQSMNDWLFSVGLQIPFGPAPQVAQAPAPVAMPAPMPPPPPPPAARNFELKADGTFAFAKSDLTPTGRTRIDNTLAELKSSGIRLRAISIVGHTDPIGSNEFNQRLSLARANSVRDYLVAHGVPANIITTEGRSFSELKVTEADCRAQGKAKTRTALIACFEPNRRVDIRATGDQPG